MAKQPLTVVARLRAQPGREQALRDTLLTLIVPSRADAGCLNYGLHQGFEDRTCFLFFENWESKQHLDEHLKRPHVQAALAKAQPLLAAPPEITLWEKIG